MKPTVDAITPAGQFLEFKTTPANIKNAFEGIAKAAGNAAQAFQALGKVFAKPHRNRAFDKICRAQTNINRQLHGKRRANWRKVRKWNNTRNKWLATFKRPR